MRPTEMMRMRLIEQVSPLTDLLDVDTHYQNTFESFNSISYSFFSFLSVYFLCIMLYRVVFRFFLSLVYSESSNSLAFRILYAKSLFEAKFKLNKDIIHNLQDRYMLMFGINIP